MAWSDIQVKLTGFGGDTVTISAHNPTASAETARARVVVTLADRTQQTLASANFTLQSQESRTIELDASGTVVSVTDGPTPIEPM